MQNRTFSNSSINIDSDVRQTDATSTTDIAWFWDSVLRDLDIQFYKPYSRIVDLSEGKPWAKWCVDGEMNIVHNMLDKYAGTPIDRRPAIKSEIEDGTSRSLTYRELRDRVDHMANSLRSLGLGKGDAIGVFMPMVPEIVVAMLAIIKIGGIFLRFSPDSAQRQLCRD